jgi:hypothetical protein
MKRYLIMASGSSTRWENHMGIPKHLATIHGEPMIYRTQRQLCDSVKPPYDLVLSATDLRYPTRLCVVGVPDDTASTRLPNTAIGQSEKFWSNTGDTVIIFGDVVFTDSAVKTIVEYQSRNITFFGRSKGFPGRKPYQELFAIHLPLARQTRMKKAMSYVCLNREGGKAGVCGGWPLYRHLNGIPITEHRITKNFVEIADGTDDIDYPVDYEWVKNL